MPPLERDYCLLRSNFHFKAIAKLCFLVAHYLSRSISTGEMHLTVRKNSGDNQQTITLQCLTGIGGVEGHPS